MPSTKRLKLKRDMLTGIISNGLAVRAYVEDVVQYAYKVALWGTVAFC